MKKTARSLILLILFICSLFGFPESVWAQEDDELSFVYGTNHFDGAIFSSTFIPPSVDTVYLLANHTSILASRLTDIYYWPITNEYKADWDTANIIVEGELEIFQGDAVIETIPMTEYVIQYDGLDRINTTRLYTDEEAVAARNNFEDQQVQYREDLYHYYEELNEYREEFQAALSDLQAGIISEEELPVAPDPLADLTLFSTDLLWGFPVNLPVGHYQIRVRTNEGEIIQDSVKDLTVFEHINEGIGYEVFSEERWSDPESSKDVNSVIYTLKDQTLYLEPYHQKQYNQLYYTRMNSPQDNTSRSDRMIWISHKPADGVILKKQGNSGSLQIKLKDYFVQQIAGSRLGYEIKTFDPETMTQPSFRAFKIDLSDMPDVFNLQLMDQDVDLIDGSKREVHVLKTNNIKWIYGLAGLPFALGLYMIYLRKRKVRDVKVVGAG